MSAQKKSDQKIPKNGDIVSLLHESGKWHEFTIRWVDDDMCILESFTRIVPMDKESLMKLLNEGE